MTRKPLITFFAVISAAALIMMTSCGLVDKIRGDIFEGVKFDDDTNYTEVKKSESVNSAYYTANEKITFGYDNLLTDSQRSCYSSIESAVYRISDTKDENGFYPVGKVTIEDKSFTEKDMDISIKAYTMDHPEAFWLTNRYSYGSMGDRAIIQMYSYVNAAECENRINTLNEAVNDIMTKIPEGLTQYHLEKYIHNTVIDNCSYAAGVESADDGWEEFTVYGALINSRAVCEGYAHSMCMLLNKVGIDCYYANGYGENNPHMWNVVKIDDRWYHLDATWDDNENAYFNFFNLNDSQIQKDHIISPLLGEIKDNEALDDVYNLFLPECSSDNANYFVVESTYIVDFEESREIMVHDLIAAAENKDDKFTIMIDPSMDFDTSLDELFNEEPYYMFDYITRANESLDSNHTINDRNVSIIILENFNSVVVKLEYK